MTIQSTEERPAKTGSGFVYLAIGLVFLLAAIGLLLRPLPLVGLARPDLGNALGDRHLEPLLRLAGVVEPCHHDPRQALADRDRKSTRLNSSHCALSRMPSSA